MEGRWKYQPDQGGSKSSGKELRRAGQPKRWFLLIAMVTAISFGCFYYWERARRGDRPSPDRADLPEIGADRSTKTASAPATVATLEPDAGEPPIAGPGALSPGPVTELIEEATQTFDRLAKLFPDNPDALELVARVQHYLGNAIVASEYWSRCLELDGRRPYAYEGMGKVAAMQGDYEKAAGFFRQTVSLAPGFSDAACELADVLMRLGNINEAVVTLEGSVSANPESADSFLLLGQAYLQLKDYQRAKKNFQTAIRIRAELSQAHFGLATAFARTGQRDKFSQQMEIFKELRAKEPRALTGMQAKVVEPAAMSANFAIAYTHAGQVYLASGDVKEAERLWWRAAAMNPRHPAGLLELVSLYEKAGRTREAIQVRRRLVAIQPTDANQHWHLGVLLARLRQWDGAEAAFKNAVELAPENPRGYAALAELCLQSGSRLSEAKTLVQKAVRLEPVARYYVLLSRVCVKIGDKPGAISAIRKAVELNPNNPLYQRLQAELEAGK